MNPVVYEMAVLTDEVAFVSVLTEVDQAVWCVNKPSGPNRTLPAPLSQAGEKKNPNADYEIRHDLNHRLSRDTFSNLCRVQSLKHEFHRGRPHTTHHASQSGTSPPCSREVSPTQASHGTLLANMPTFQFTQTCSESIMSTTAHVNSFHHLAWCAKENRNGER